MRVIRSILWLLVVAVLLVFVVQNSNELARGASFRIDLFVKDLSIGSIPIYGIMLFSCLIGLIIGGGWGALRQLKLRAQLKRAGRLLLEKEKELDSLRNLPVLESQLQGQGEIPSTPTYDPPR